MRWEATGTIWRVGVAMAAASKTKMLKILAKTGNPNTVIFVCLLVLFVFPFVLFCYFFGFFKMTVVAYS